MMIGGLRYAAVLAAILASANVAALEFRSITEPAAILYDAPSAKAQKVFILSQGYPVEVVVKLEGWAKIRDDSGATAGTGQFLWQPSQQLGEPDRIHGIPVLMSEYVPAVFTTGKYVGAIADFGFYHIADALDMQVQRLNELFALTNQTGMIMRKETDGMPVLAEAFSRVKLG